MAAFGRRALAGTPLDQLRSEAEELVTAELGEHAVALLAPAVGGAPPDVLVGPERDFLWGVADTLAAVGERERAEARFRELADAVPAFIWTADDHGMVDFINRGWLDFTGRPLEEELGDSWAVGVHPEDAEQVSSTWWRAFKRKVPWEQEYRLRRHDGQYRWIVDRGVPRFVEGELVGYVGAATDIDERKQMEESLAAAQARDQEVAETLQRSMLPESLPLIGGVELEARYLPAIRHTEVGGDWYDAVELDDGRLAVVVGDVVGHGLRAAATMGQLRNAFRAYTLTQGVIDVASPGQTLGRLNKLLLKEGRGQSATVFHMVIDRDTGHATYASAGHPPALVIGTGEPVFLEGGRSAPLGVADPIFKEDTTVLAAGSTLLLYTDGLVERRDTPLEDRLAQLATAATVADGELGDVCDQVLSGILGGRRAPDDVALLAVRLEIQSSESLRLSLAADPLVLGLLRRRLGRFLDATGITAHDRFEISLAACEAASNAIEHAYGPGDADFEVEASVEAGEISVTVRDSGSWREPRVPVGEDSLAGGRGLRIIEGLMDSVDVSRGGRGTTVRMRRRLGVREAPDTNR